MGMVLAFVAGMLAALTTRRPDRSLDERIVAASENIRNALVPLQTIAELLHRPDDARSRDWCAWMLNREVKRIVDILDGL